MYHKEDHIVYKSAVAVEARFESLWKDVEKELERLAEVMSFDIHVYKVKCDSNTAGKNNTG